MPYCVSIEAPTCQTPKFSLFITLVPARHASSPRRLPLGYLRSLVEAMRQSCVDIVPHGLDVASYDLIVIGTPVWAGSVSSPVRAYLAENRQQLPHVAFFCSLGGRGSESPAGTVRAECS